MKDFFKNPQNILLTTTCLVLVSYFGLKFFKEIESLKPQTRSEKIMHCLELGSDARAKACLELITKPKLGTYEPLRD